MSNSRYFMSKSLIQNTMLSYPFVSACLLRAFLQLGHCGMYILRCVRRFELLTWSLIIIYNLTLFWSNIKYLSEYMFFCVFKNESASNPVLANITSCSNCINLLYLLNFRFICKIFLTILRWFLKICIIRVIFTLKQRIFGRATALPSP